VVSPAEFEDRAGSSHQDVVDCEEASRVETGDELSVVVGVAGLVGVEVDEVDAGSGG
jgi:hypothetical protein